jgi:hypothetical protein
MDKVFAKSNYHLKCMHQLHIYCPCLFKFEGSFIDKLFFEFSFIVGVFYCIQGKTSWHLSDVNKIPIFETMVCQKTPWVEYGCCCHYHTKFNKLKEGLNGIKSCAKVVHGQCHCPCIKTCHHNGEDFGSTKCPTHITCRNRPKCTHSICNYMCLPHFCNYFFYWSYLRLHCN